LQHSNAVNGFSSFEDVEHVTRLTEAFERAHASDVTPAEPSEPRLSDVGQAAVVPPTWRFEDQELQRIGQLSTPGAVETADAAEGLPITPEDLERTEYPFARKPAIASRLVVGPSPNHTVVEQFRHLAASLHHAQLRTGTKTVMVTSAVEAEGKTTTSVNLALTFSHSHRRRVLLVDADLRRPSIHTLFQLSNHEGLTDALKVVTPEAPLPLHKISPTLTVLTAGAPTADPMSVLVSEMMKEFMREAADQYDWVILDTPPVALLSDANLLAAMIDAAIIVVGANTTPYPLVRRAVEAIGPSKVLGTVLNRARRPGIGARYRYAYSYGYRYTAQETRPPTRGKGWVFPFKRSR
jgi:capsular exopolysaccharide synthesis family protein